MIGPAKVILLPCDGNDNGVHHILYQNQNMTKRLAFGVWLAVMGLLACRNDAPRDIRNYYFPLKQLTQGLVYEYRAADTLTPAYWYYRSILGQEGNFLTATYYEQELEPLQTAREEMVTNGILLRDLRLHTPGNAGVSQTTPVKIEHGNVFPFYVTDSLGVFLYKVSWTDEEGQQITLTRNRRFSGDTSFHFEGRTWPGVVFSLMESIELDHPQQGYFEQQLQGKEGYAKGLGLFFYGKAPKGQPPVIFSLQQRYPMAELEKKAKR